jgi:LmbE family N-acetylglucosaminyl deacetylase
MRLTPKKFSLAFALLALCSGAICSAQMAPPALGPDERYKADILVVVAHPDDETEITGYLARAIYEEHKRVAVVFGTRGNGGGDAAGYAQAAALSAEREIEARKALASFGVMNVWFLDGPDTPGQDVLRSLETWNHGSALWKAIRIMRLTRPQVVMTWLPVYVAGENHGDHQAAGVIATEAFDLAGDPSFFPEQVAAPRDYLNIGNLTEGLHPWQPQKLYYFSDATDQSFMDGKGPQYSTLDQSPSQHKPYYLLAAEEMSHHLTQGDTGQMATKSLQTGDFAYFKVPVRMVLGKSLVKASATGDAFEGVTADAIAYVRPPGYQPEAAKEVNSLELGGPFAFYREFWRTHQLDSVRDLLPPEVEIGATSQLHIPLLLHGSNGQVVALNLDMPKGWQRLYQDYDHYDQFPMKDGQPYPVTLNLQSPNTPSKDWQKIQITATSNGQKVGSVTVLVRLTKDFGLPQ